MQIVDVKLVIVHELKHFACLLRCEQLCHWRQLRLDRDTLYGLQQDLRGLFLAKLALHAWDLLNIGLHELSRWDVWEALHQSLHHLNQHSMLRLQRLEMLEVRRRLRDVVVEL